MEGLQREMRIRKRVQNIYNRRRDDFGTLQEYNDYLEEVEDIVYNLLERIDVKETEARIQRYQKEHQEEIVANQVREAQERLEEEKHLLGSPAQALQTDVDQTNMERNYTPGPIEKEVSIVLPTPILHAVDNIEDMDPETRRLRELMAIEAGGWRAEIAQRRALEEAFGALVL